MPRGSVLGRDEHDHYMMSRMDHNRSLLGFIMSNNDGRKDGPKEGHASQQPITKVIDKLVQKKASGEDPSSLKHMTNQKMS